MLGMRRAGVIEAKRQPLLYAITSGTASDVAELVAQAERWARARVDIVQLREPQLSPAMLCDAAQAMVGVLRSLSQTRLLVNTRADVAVAVQADGVHLTSRPGELTAPQIRTLYERAGLPRPLVSISCHTLDDVRRARVQQVDMLLFGPVLEKRAQGTLVRTGVGLELLRQACEMADPVPVLALGGVNESHEQACLDAGAAGLAGIRMFASARGRR